MGDAATLACVENADVDPGSATRRGAAVARVPSTATT
jgi:hypothetical protein